MNFENQGVIKRLADQYGPENLTVVLGNGEANGVEVFAETVTQGDPSYAGPLAGVALRIPVYHVLEEDVMAQVPEKLREEKLQLSSLVIDIEPMHQALEALRDGHIRNALFVSKWSLFLGRMTQMSDGCSFMVERNEN